MSRASRRIDALATRYVFELVEAAGELRLAWRHVLRARDALRRAGSVLDKPPAPATPAVPPASSVPTSGQSCAGSSAAPMALGPVCRGCGRAGSLPATLGPMICLTCGRAMQMGGRA